LCHQFFSREGRTEIRRERRGRERGKGEEKDNQKISLMSYWNRKEITGTNKIGGDLFLTMAPLSSEEVVGVHLKKHQKRMLLVHVSGEE
jgi:hypothetical protein